MPPAGRFYTPSIYYPNTPYDFPIANSTSLADTDQEGRSLRARVERGCRLRVGFRERRKGIRSGKSPHAPQVFVNAGTPETAFG